VMTAGCGLISHAKLVFPNRLTLQSLSYLFCVKGVRLQNFAKAEEFILIRNFENGCTHQPIQSDHTTFSAFKQKGLHFLRMYIHSTLTKLYQLKQLAEDMKAAVIGLTETWLDDSVHNCKISISQYSLERKERNRKGSGICTYIRNDLAFNRRTAQQAY